jgi:pimeloyl-ACP methyl ester carboxylesterase
MATAAQPYTEELVEVAGVQLELVRGGTGEPLLILHNELGNPGWFRFHQALAEHYTLYIPSHPGWGNSQRLEWAMNVRDLVGWYAAALRDLGLTSCNVVGFSFGGWIAAELAVLNPGQFKKMVLVNPMGIKPREGEILQFLITARPTLIAKQFHNVDAVPEIAQLYGGPDPRPDDLEQWEINREATARLAWKPFMFDLAMPYLAPTIKVPTLILCSQYDEVVPIDCGRQYHELIEGSRFRVIEDCGHAAEIEKPVEVADAIREFLAS